MNRNVQTCHQFKQLKEKKNRILIKIKDELGLEKILNLKTN